MTEKRRWWEKKWWWMLCILLPWVLGPAINFFFFPEIPLSRSLVYAIASSVAILLAYFAYMKKPIFKIQPKTLRRIIFMGGGASIGFFLFAFIVIPLTYYFNIPHAYGPILLLLLFVLMVVCAFIVDTIMKRRDYRPFIEKGGNI